ncbi:MAG: transposase [Thermomicrobiales bacterium]|nr:transposase [Thermomicrobiales bacterium]
MRWGRKSRKRESRLGRKEAGLRRPAGGGARQLAQHVEIEIEVLKPQCLDRRIDDREELAREIAAWERQRNLAGAHLKWMFTTEKARTKMDRAYPRPAATLDQPAKKS